MALAFRPNGRSIKISMQSIIPDTFTVGDSGKLPIMAIIILSAFAAVRSIAHPHDVEDDVDLQNF